MSAQTKPRWTDGRLDDLADRVSDGFARMDREFARVDTRLDRIDSRFDALQRTLIQVGGGLIASVLVAGAGIAATQL